MNTTTLVCSHLKIPPLRLNCLYTAKPPSNPMATPKWAQKTITLSPQRRGCHLITPKILNEIGGDLSQFNCGLAHFFLQHTSASLTINENYDSDVRDDTETFLNRIVPEGNSAPWKHTLEGFQSQMGSLIWAPGRFVNSDFSLDNPVNCNYSTAFNKYAKSGDISCQYT